MPALRLTSPAFMAGGRTPKKFTCDGENVAPPLEWSRLPDESKTVALICEDADASSGTFTHWLLYDIPASKHRVDEGASFGKSGLNAAHFHHFHVYALASA